MSNSKGKRQKAKLLISFLLFLSFAFLITPAYAVTNDCESALRGQCQNTSNPCAGRYVPGHCPGGTNNQCCVADVESILEGGNRGLKSSGALIEVFAFKANFASTSTEPEVVIGRIIQGLMLLIGVIFGILIIYGGYLWMIARGNEEYVKKSMEVLKAAVIGFILVVGAYAITNYVVEKVISAAFTPSI